MDIIKEVKIKNFRSIISLGRTLIPTHLNIFVGQNDQGKSNVLRALNLFFNGQTDIGVPLRFEDDYSYFAPTGRGKKVEIIVELLIDPPKNRFKKSTPVIWTKVWKKDGSVRETRKHPDGSTLSDRNNVSQWLNKLRYRYVPAIKGQEYFSALMGELYDVLNIIHSEKLAEQGEGFIGGIQNITKEITDDLEDQLGIPNTIQVPSDFKVLFSNLDFGLKKDGNTYHLKQRGDGVKVRHIPIILKYMSEQERNVTIKGYVKPDTIWGFEEPENNLEFRYAFEVAEEIKSYSKDIQIFLTTHSPAFYALDKTDNDGVTAFYVSLNEKNTTELKLITHEDNQDIHKNMGFLPIITPYLEEIFEKDKKLSEAIEQINALKPNSKCYVLTEDKNQELISTLFEHNGFIRDETEYFSYNGADSFHAAIILGNYIKSKNNDANILIHRDRDYLSDEQINDLKVKAEKYGYFFFTTIGTDVESCFINKDHILKLYRQLTLEQVDQAIKESTQETKDQSLKRIVNHYMKTEKPQNGDFYGKTKQLEQLYDKNPERYRYGKKVLGKLSGKIQQLVRENCDLLQYSDSLILDSLAEIYKQVWVEI